MSLNTFFSISFTEGAVPALFQHKGVVQADYLSNTSLETAVEHAIEVGAEDVTEEDTDDGKILQVTIQHTVQY